MSEPGGRPPVLVIGAGLAGSEAAWQLARRGHAVELREMRPETMTPAHHTAKAAELVCTNSFKSDVPQVAAGLLKEELRRLGSLVLTAADAARVPSGQDLSVDRDRFSAGVEAGLAAAGVRRTSGEVTAIDPDRWTIVATGPLTSPTLAAEVERLAGAEHLHFYDAAAPIVFGESLDQGELFRASRTTRAPGTISTRPSTALRIRPSSPPSSRGSRSSARTSRPPAGSRAASRSRSLPAADRRPSATAR